MVWNVPAENMTSGHSAKWREIFKEQDNMFWHFSSFKNLCLAFFCFDFKAINGTVYNKCRSLDEALLARYKISSFLWNFCWNVLLKFGLGKASLLDSAVLIGFVIFFSRRKLLWSQGGCLQATITLGKTWIKVNTIL